MFKSKDHCFPKSTTAVFFFFLLFWRCHLACQISVPWPWMEARLPALEAWSFNDWTTGKLPVCCQRLHVRWQFVSSHPICAHMQMDPQLGRAVLNPNSVFKSAFKANDPSLHVKICIFTLDVTGINGNVTSPRFFLKWFCLAFFGPKDLFLKSLKVSEFYFAAKA